MKFLVLGNFQLFSDLVIGIQFVFLGDSVFSDRRFSSCRIQFLSIYSLVHGIQFVPDFLVLEFSS